MASTNAMAEIQAQKQDELRKLLGIETTGAYNEVAVLDALIILARRLTQLEAQTSADKRSKRTA